MTESSRIVMNSLPSDLPWCVRQPLQELASRSDRGQRRWLASFRRRWGARVGKLPNREHLQPELIRRKSVAYYKWINHAQSCAPASKPPLLVNMDETSLALSFEGAVGTVVCSKHIPQTLLAPTADVSTGDTHGHVTFASMITHDTSIQPLLPQVLLGNEHVLTQVLLKEIQPHVPNNVTLLRMKSGWNCHQVMRKILSLLAKALEEVMKERYVILLLDVHRSHFDQTIFTHARKLGIRLVYIPAKLTFLLQPCDTHYFAKLKSALRSAWRIARCSKDDKLSKVEWLKIIFKCARQVLQGTAWDKAFRSTGALALQQEVSPRVFYRMGLTVRPHVPSGPPSREEACLIFPSRAKINVMTHVMWCPAKDLMATASSPPASSSHGIASGSGCAASSSGVAAESALPSSVGATCSAASSSDAALSSASCKPVTGSLAAKAHKWVLRPRKTKTAPDLD